MATQKDYISMAAELHKARKSGNDQYTWSSCVDAVVRSFAGGNVRLKAELFRNACGYYDPWPTEKGNKDYGNG